MNITRVELGYPAQIRQKAAPGRAVVQAQGHIGDAVFDLCNTFGPLGQGIKIALIGLAGI